MDYSNWMSETTAIHDNLLYNITLPCTHDSGTYNLTNILTEGLGSDEQAMAALLSMAANGISIIPGIFQYISNPCSWIYNMVEPCISGLMTATTKPVSRQLKEGIRCLDLRIYYDSNSQQFYTYHTLIGSPLTAVLVDLGSFLQTSTAEIVYVTFSHFRGFGDGDGQIVSSLSDTVKAYLGDFVYNPGSSVENPFNLTYNQIVTQDSTTPKSRAILVWGTTQPPDPIFLPENYSPPDNDNGSISHIVGGVYTDTDTFATMTSDQGQQYKNRNIDQPFALFLTLTPQDTSVGNILGYVLYDGITGKADTIPEPISDEMKAVANKIKPNVPLPLPYTTLEKLSEDVDNDPVGVINTYILQGTSQIQPLSFLYVDFYENTYNPNTDKQTQYVVDIAIQLSLGQTPTSTA
jgi:hypothetical protein